MEVKQKAVTNVLLLDALNDEPGCIPCKLHAKGAPESVCGVPKMTPVQHQPKLITKEIKFHPVSKANYSRIYANQNPFP